MEHGILTLAPALLAIGLAIWTGQVVLSLAAGLWLAELILNQGNIFLSLTSMLDSVVGIFAEAWVTKTLFFCALVGAIITITQASGGIQGLLNFLTQKTKLVQSRKGAMLLAYFIGVIVFIESSITILLSGTIAKPITDKFKVSRENLAYICDSTSAPICGLIPLNAWGATIMGVIAAQISAGVIVGNPVDFLLGSLPYQFYSWVSILLVLFFILTGKHFGSMKKAEDRAMQTGKLLADDAQAVVEENLTQVDMVAKAKPNVFNLLLPIGMMMAMMPIGLYITGKGNMMQGSGSTSVFWAVLLALFMSGLQNVLFQRNMRIGEFMQYVYKGVGAMIPVVSILIFAFAIGKTMGDLGTGKYLANLVADSLPVAFLPLVVFWLSAIMAFSTGTSFGTFGLMIPIALQMGAPMDANLYALIGAVVSGGIFGDHCSPISDTTIMASMVTASDHIHHVKTQMPYALLGAVISSVMFVLAGFIF